jgi:hypothetical protein
MTVKDADAQPGEDKASDLTAGGKTAKAWNTPASVAPNSPIELLAATRSMAEKWTTTVTGLTGILGLAGIAFGKDALSGAPGLQQGLAVGLYFVSVITAALALIACTAASHGLPPMPGGQRWTTKLRGWTADGARADEAARALWVGMFFGVLTFFLALVALGIALIPV